MHSQHQQKWSASYQSIHSYLLICASISEFVFKPQRRSAINPLIGAIQHRPDTQPATAPWCRQSVKHYAISSSVIRRGALVNCTHSWFPFHPSFFSRVVIHSHKKRRRVCEGRIYTGASFENHPVCHSSPFLCRGPDRSAFFFPLRSQSILQNLLFVSRDFVSTCSLF